MLCSAGDVSAEIDTTVAAFIIVAVEMVAAVVELVMGDGIGGLAPAAARKFVRLI